MRNWSVTEKLLAVLAATVFVVVGVLGVLALTRGGGEEIPEGCEGATDDSGLVTDLGPSDALRVFVQARPEQFPVDDSWRLESDDGGMYVFVSDRDGYYEIEVERGSVQRYLSCPAD